MPNRAQCLIAVLLLTGLASLAQEVKFSGTADKKYDGNKIVLYNRATGDHDSAVLKDGKFVLTVSFKEPTRYFFFTVIMSGEQRVVMLPMEYW